MPKTTKRQGGRTSLYPGKLRHLPVSVTMTKAHHAKVRAATKRLGITRSDLISLLVDKFSEVVEIPPGARVDVDRKADEN